MGAPAALAGRGPIPAATPDRTVRGRLYCPAAKLVIEIDGQIHNFTVERDLARDEYIRGLRIQIMRISASDVMADALSIADGLVRLCGPSTTQLG